MEIIEESDSIETAAIGLTLDQQLEIIEEAADDCGYGDLTFSLDSLRTELESYAVMFIHLLAESRTYGIFGDLFDFMEEHGLEPEDMTNTNNFGWLAQASEREEGPCTIYEYRNVEDPGNHVDIWEYRLTDDESVYFEVWRKESGAGSEE